MPGDGVRACYPRAAGFGLLVAEMDDGRTVAAVDGLATMTNDRLAADGNAALAIGLLGGILVLVPALYLLLMMGVALLVSLLLFIVPEKD